MEQNKQTNKQRFIKIYDESVQTKGVGQCGHFSDKEGINFCNFVPISFMDIVQCKWRFTSTPSLFFLTYIFEIPITSN